MPTIAVACQDLTKTYDGVPVVQRLSFAVAAGEILALLGPSGCGKTTTLRLIAGFDRLDTGRIEIDGRVVADTGRHQPPEKRRAGMVFQDYAIFPHLSVADNIAFGLNRDSGAEARVAAMLQFVGLSQQGNKMPHQLSGGQQQRVALARALAPEPAVLLLDEPFSNLDASLRQSVRREVRQLLQRSRTTAIFVTHDQEEALFMGDQVAVMNAGRLEQVGTPETVFHRPRTRFVADFVGQTDFISGNVVAGGVETPLGLLVRRLDLPPGTPVELALRPDDVRLLADEDGNGVVEEREFAGLTYMYRVALADGSQVHSWQPHTLRLAPGSRVAVSFRPGHDVPCFYQGLAVT